MENTTEYRIVESTRIRHLEELIQRYIQQGWKLQGGIGVHTENGQTKYFQAIIYENSN